MRLEAVLVVGLIVLGALVALAVHVAWLRARVLRHEHSNAELSRSIATVQGWAAVELRALRHEFTVARVDASAAVALAQLERRREAVPAPPPEPEDDPEERRDTVAMPAPAAEHGDDDGEETAFLDPLPPMYASRSPLIRPPAPLAHSDLSDSEDAADEAARAHLDPEEKTPPRRGRSALMVPAFREHNQGDDA